MKYVMLVDSNGIFYPVIFPEALVHADVELLIRKLILRNGAMAGPISAGFVQLGLDTQTFGKSETLGMQAREEDAIRMILGTSGNSIPSTMLPDILQKMKARAKAK